jgi:hypothetical protein
MQTCDARGRSECEGAMLSGGMRAICWNFIFLNLQKRTLCALRNWRDDVSFGGEGNVMTVWNRDRVR